MSSEFPAFIKAEYVEGDAFSRFQRDVTQTLEGTRQRFERSFSEISNVISKAITRPAGAGRIDLGLPDFRQAAAEARAYQASIEATLTSSRTLAQLTGDVSAETRSYIQALTAQNAEARQAVAAADAQVTTYTRLQTALNATADANSRLAQAQREVYAEQARAAQIEVQQRQRQQALNQVFAPGLSSRATDNGAGFGALDAMVRQQQQAAAAQQAYAASAAALRAELDPMFVAQQRFNTALDRAEELLKAGTITTREYEQAQELATEQLQQHAQSLFQVEAAQGRGTTATRINTESQRANRFAMIQAGQQLQDITISLQSGQRATTVFAQQLPQLAFAFTDVGGKVGAVAQFLAGPWGVAVFGAVTALGFLIESLIETSDFLKSTGDEADATATRIAAAMQRLTAFGQSASEMTKLFTDSSDVRIDAARKEARAARLEIDAQRLREEARRPGGGLDKEYTDRRATAIKRAAAAEAEAKALRSEASAQKAQADAALRAADIQKRNDDAIKATDAIVRGGSGGGGSSRARGGGGRGGVDKSAIEAARELDQLESKIQSLESRLDPATSAAREFADALEAINLAAERGVISTGRAQELSTAAIFAEGKRTSAESSAEISSFMQVYNPIDLDGLVESAEQYVRRVSAGWQEAQSGAADQFTNALQTMDIFRSLLSGRGGLLRAVAGGVLGVGGQKLQEGFSAGYTSSIGDLQIAFGSALEEVFGKDAVNIGKSLGSFAANAQIGSQIAGVTGGSKAAGAVGGVLGSELGKSLASGPLGKALGSLSSALGPLGGIVGGIALGALGSALTPAKRGSATIGGSGGNLVVSSTRGNSKSRIAQSTDSADEAITTLERIAEALGGTVDASRGSVSIGVRGKSFRVDTSGQGITKTKRGAIDFGEDSAAAIKFATMDLIKDGVIVGLRASTQRLLQNSKDLDAAIQKALDFQSVFDRLQARLDPVGAAITGIDREFNRLRNIFGEAAASVEELADLEKLYTLEREEAVKEANERVLGSMKALLDDLRFGDNGRSLRDRLAAAQAKFDPLAARVQAGDITAYDDFAEAARTLLDIQRQFSGSQTAFFELQDRITAITAKVVEGGNVASILPGSSASAQADAQRAYDGSNVVSAIDRQTEELARILTQVVGGTLVAINDNVAGGPVSGGRVDIPGFFAQNVRQI